MEPLRKAHQLAMQSTEGLRRELEQNPDFKKQVEYNIRTYRVPFISGSYGARWKEDLVKDVSQLLHEDFPHHLVEVRVYPEDPDGHHWGVEYNLVVWDSDRGFVKAVDYERLKKRGGGNGGNQGCCFEDLSK